MQEKGYQKIKTQVIVFEKSSQKIYKSVRRPPITLLWQKDVE